MNKVNQRLDISRLSVRGIGTALFIRNAGQMEQTFILLNINVFEIFGNFSYNINFSTV